MGGGVLGEPCDGATDVLEPRVGLAREQQRTGEVSTGVGGVGVALAGPRGLERSGPDPHGGADVHFEGQQPARLREDPGALPPSGLQRRDRPSSPSRTARSSWPSACAMSMREPWKRARREAGVPSGSVTPSSTPRASSCRSRLSASSAVRIRSNKRATRLRSPCQERQRETSVASPCVSGCAGSSTASCSARSRSPSIATEVTSLQTSLVARARRSPGSSFAANAARALRISAAWGSGSTSSQWSVIRLLSRSTSLKACVFASSASSASLRRASIIVAAATAPTSRAAPAPPATRRAVRRAISRSR